MVQATAGRKEDERYCAPLYIHGAVGNVGVARVDGSLAPPTYLLPLNFHFTSVLGLGLLNMNAFHGNQISGGPISEQRERLGTMTSRSRASFSCSQRKTIEKDTREAIRSVVGSLPKSDQLKPEQEQLCKVLLVAMMLWRFAPPGSGKV